MSANLTEEELNEFREIFNLVDKDGGGTISKDEFGDLMDTLGINATSEEIDIMINEIDADGTGDIDFEEFVAVMSRKVNTSYTSSQVKNAFKVFENPMHPGYIKVEQLLEALTTYGSKQMTSEQARELISQLEPDPNGLINYEEYISMMMNE